MLVLASQSASRKAMLAAAGVPFEAIPAAIDERALEAGLTDRPAHDIAQALADAKALSVASHNPARLVLGSDSLVTVAGQRFDKPTSIENAAEHLRLFSGRTMELHSAATLARGDEVLWRGVEIAELQVRELGEAFIADYLAHEWPEVRYCVGVFRIEARGVQLFEAIRGNQFAVLGMPLLPVLAALRDLGELPA